MYLILLRFGINDNCQVNTHYSDWWRSDGGSIGGSIWDDGNIPVVAEDQFALTYADLTLYFLELHKTEPSWSLQPTVKQQYFQCSGRSSKNTTESLPFQILWQCWTAKLGTNEVKSVRERQRILHVISSHRSTNTTRQTLLAFDDPKQETHSVLL